MEMTIACQPIRLNYFLRIPNVGDRINPAIVTAVSGHPTVHVAGSDDIHLLAAGSMMAAANPLSHIWGTGVMHPDFGVGSVTAPNIHALRGKLSHSALRQTGIKISDVPLGDPGFLAPALLRITRSTTPTYRLGVVPHYVDRDSQHFRRLSAGSDVADLNVHNDPERFLRTMADCEVVISSSLHGLIFAEALGIPNLWVTSTGDIGGGPFKFNDWFSTTVKPQTAAHALTSEDTVVTLMNRATLHDSKIEVEALKTAFPHNKLDDIRELHIRHIVSTEACRARPVPTFLISFNRGAMLEKVIASINRLDQSTEIVVHDNGSTDVTTLSILDKLANSGTRVVRCEAIKSAEDLNNVNDTVKSFFSDWAEPSRYIVSDCDIDMTIATSETIHLYDELLNSFRHVESVGPMLRIRDIPITYHLFNQVMNRHIEQFWHKQPNWTETSFGPVAYVEAPIDTTFALHRAGEPFRRFKRSLRVYEPYEAQHLDWYIDSIVSDVYSKTSHPSISHWNNTVELDIHITAKLEYDHYYTVRRDEAGTLEVYKEQLPTRYSGDVHHGLIEPIIPFTEATVSQKRDRILHTEALRRTHGTDKERWGNIASHNEFLAAAR